MAHKESKIILNVDLECSRCYKKIKEVLCKYRERYQIEKEIFDEKNSTITISGPFCPCELSKKLRCKAGNVIKCYKIVEKNQPETETPPKPEPLIVDPPPPIVNPPLPTVDSPPTTVDPPPGREADWQLIQQVVVYCGPSGYIPPPPAPSYSGSLCTSFSEEDPNACMVM